MLLPHLIPPKGLKKYNGKCYKPSIASAKASLIKHANIPGDMTLIKEEARKHAEMLKITLQPYIIILGSPYEVKETYVQVDDILYKTNSALEAIDTRIVGGMETGVNEYPMMAALIYQGRQVCAATIISVKHVLTAAHCVRNRTPSTVRVLVGDHDLSTDADTNASRLLTVATINRHPLFTNGSLRNDLAVILVNPVIIFSAEVGPACLPFRHRYDSFTGSQVVKLGWGGTGTEIKSNVLQKVTVNVISNMQCSQDYQYVPNNEMCTYGEGKGSCKGDSGGPVLWQDPLTGREVLVGVISSQTNPQVCGDTIGISMRVSEFISWIYSVTPGIIWYAYE